MAKLVEHKEVFSPAELTNYSNGGIVSQQLTKCDVGNITLFAFDQGQALSEHTAPFDATVQVLEGEADFYIEGKAFRVTKGEMIIMPANIPHAVKAITKFKMMLIMIKG